VPLSPGIERTSVPIWIEKKGEVTPTSKGPHLRKNEGSIADKIREGKGEGEKKNLHEGERKTRGVRWPESFRKDGR